MYFPSVTVEGTKQMDNILTGESSGFQSADLHLEEQPDPTEDTNLTVRKNILFDL